ncbi:hypothetical protein RIF29_21488 [Crotalaria pallida]|uniref:Uncharacterized protein n=1 Tax=Crotalaria pallida TaxID=3830 RepID=A0AAN9I8G6_CROPI
MTEPQAVVDDKKIKENLGIVQDQGENQGNYLVVGNGVAEIMEKNDEEAMHGDWLIVRRRKKGGKEKNLRLNSDKYTGMISQSLLVKDFNHEEIPMHGEFMVTKPHSMNMHADSPTSNTSGGTRYGNGKKWAGKDSPHMSAMSLVMKGSNKGGKHPDPTGMKGNRGANSKSMNKHVGSLKVGQLDVGVQQVTLGGSSKTGDSSLQWVSGQ